VRLSWLSALGSGLDDNRHVFSNSSGLPSADAPSLIILCDVLSVLFGVLLLPYSFLALLILDVGGEPIAQLALVPLSAVTPPLGFEFRFLGSCHTDK